MYMLEIPNIISGLSVFNCLYKQLSSYVVYVYTPIVLSGQELFVHPLHTLTVTHTVKNDTEHEHVCVDCLRQSAN